MAGPQGNDMCYVAGLPDTVTEDDLSKIFGSIGQLKYDKKKEAGANHVTAMGSLFAAHQLWAACRLVAACRRLSHHRAQ